MKKTISLLLSVALLLLVSLGSLTGCNSKPSNVIRICETARSIFYAPMYVAVNNGYFEDEGLDVSVTTVQGSDLVMTTVISGDAEVGLMGPETTVYCKSNGQKDYPMVFAQLTKRDGSFLVAKSPDENFSFDKLKNKHVLAGRAGGLPAMTMQYVVNKAGLTLSDLTFNTDVSFGMMASVFESDDSVHYTTMFEPTASEYVSKGKGHIVASIGEYSGEVPYTAFSASKSYIEENRDNLKKFVKAIIKGYEYILDAKPSEVAKAVAPHFDGISLEMLEASVVSYKSIDAWSDTPVMSETAFNKLVAIMKNADYFSGEVKFADIVDNSIASEVVNNL